AGRVHRAYAPQSPRQRPAARGPPRAGLSGGGGRGRGHDRRVDLEGPEGGRGGGRAGGGRVRAAGPRSRSPAGLRSICRSLPPADDPVRVPPAPRRLPRLTVVAARRRSQPIGCSTRPAASPPIDRCHLATTRIPDHPAWRIVCSLTTNKCATRDGLWPCPSMGAWGTLGLEATRPATSATTLRRQPRTRTRPS